MDKARAVKSMIRSFEKCVESKNTSRINDARRRLVDSYTSQARKFAGLNGIIAELRREVLGLRAKLARYEEDW